MLALLLDLVDDEDREKFQIVYYKYENLVRYICLKKLGNPNDADDSAQLAWFDIAKNFKKVGDPYDSKTKNYIATIANGWANKVYNKEAEINNNIEFNEDILTNAQSDDFFNSIDIKDIAMIIDKLPERQKLFLYYKYNFGLTSKEIGKKFGVSDALVRKTIQFAKAKIRQEFEK